MNIVINDEDNFNNLVVDQENMDDSDYLYCTEEELFDELEDDFNYTIKNRGKDYYNSGKVLVCYKHGNKYFAKVQGSSEKPYMVNFEITDYDIDYDCTCPCDFPCKHEYAVLLAIANHKYSYINLKPEIMAKDENFINILNKIPSEEIKEYLISSIENNGVIFDMDMFKEHFEKYYPNQSYEYYYNCLYNALTLFPEYTLKFDLYIDKIKYYISTFKYDEGFKIIKSIINAYNDTNTLNSDIYIISVFPTIGMFLRVIYRKCDINTKNEINNWIITIKIENYYNNPYLEDIITMMNF